MTALLDRPVDTTAWTVGEPRLLAGLAEQFRLDLAGHIAVHGLLPPAGNSEVATIGVSPLAKIPEN